MNELELYRQHQEIFLAECMKMLAEIFLIVDQENNRSLLLKEKYFVRFTD